ncbi:MAG: galactonate dehydratase [Chloroflexi bacterium]|nr:galactonate dehydratase [Chloroflexota bacterium]
MKIESVTALVVNARQRNWVFVKMVTDQPGLIGWGEATIEWNTRAVVGAVEDAADFLVGEDPRRTEHLWQVLYRQRFFRGGAVVMSAISGIDQALHDIKAKDLGVPLYQLLGGLVRDRVRLYDHLGGGDTDAVYNDAAADRFAERAREIVGRGFTALKILAVPRTGMLDGVYGVRQAVGLMSAVREAVGDDVEVMVDLHGRTTPAMAIQYGHALAPLRPWFLEEPCPPGNVAALAEVARALPIPIATGERLVTRYEFREVLEQRACAVIQPDACHCGGISELKRIAAMAEPYFVSVAPHNPVGPIGTMAAIHFALSTPNFLIQEVMSADVPWRAEVVDQPLEIYQGHVLPPTRPGLGVEVDERAAARYAQGPEPKLRYFHPDGAVADW